MINWPKLDKDDPKSSMYITSPPRSDTSNQAMLATKLESSLPLMGNVLSKSKELHPTNVFIGSNSPRKER